MDIRITAKDNCEKCLSLLFSHRKVFVAVVLISQSVCRCCSYIEKCLPLLFLYRKVFVAVVLISKSVCHCCSDIEKCLSLLFLYRKVFVAVVLISKKREPQGTRLLISLLI